MTTETPKPGVYKAMVRGIPGESIVIAGKGEMGRANAYALNPDGNVRACYTVDGARPLILLDLTGVTSSEGAVEHLRRCSTADGYCLTNIIADQIEEQIKPPRMSEPGIWAVVLASTNNHDPMDYVHYPEGWAPVRHRRPYLWDELIDPLIIRHGLVIT